MNRYTILSLQTFVLEKEKPEHLKTIRYKAATKEVLEQIKLVRSKEIIIPNKKIDQKGNPFLVIEKSNREAKKLLENITSIQTYNIIEEGKTYKELKKMWKDLRRSHEWVYINSWVENTEDNKNKENHEKSFIFIRLETHLAKEIKKIFKL